VTVGNDLNDGMTDGEIVANGDPKFDENVGTLYT
jgi:hypothetical protein